ncbi:MAG: hypothetical protein L0Z55_05865, partial [Planctomycetes bacterium]|nr:hypothetical protein [Planctomycetota bacterium]
MSRAFRGLWLVLAVFATQHSMAAEDAKPPAAPQESSAELQAWQEIGGLSLRNVESLETWAREHEVPLPRAILPAELRESLKRISSGGIDHTRPIGMRFVAGPNVAAAQRAVIICSVLRPEVERAALVRASQGKPLPPDGVVVLGNQAFRLMGGSGLP